MIAFLRFVLICIGLLVSEAAAEEQAKSKPARGLDDITQRKLDDLLKVQRDHESFAKKLEEVSATGKYSSVIVLTHAMIQLPWDDTLKPKHRTDRRMPKLAVERRLDELVAAPEHDKLSAQYFRAVLKNEGDVKEAEKQLLDWTIRKEKELQWDGERFVPAPKDVN